MWALPGSGEYIYAHTKGLQKCLDLNLPSYFSDSSDGVRTVVRAQEYTLSLGFECF